MRIAFIGGFAFSPKGTIRARAHPMTAELVKLGHEVTIFLPPYDNLENSGQEWEQEGVWIRNMKAGARAWSYPHLLSSLVLEVNHYSPDVIHVFKPKGFAGAAATYFLLRGTRSLALDCDDWEGWGGWNEVKQYPWVVKEFIARQESWLMRSAPAVTVASRTLQDRVAHVRGGREGIYYVPNCGASAAGQEMQRAVRALSQEEVRRQLGLPEGPIVLYSGHFEDAQSVDFFCRAAQSAIAQEQVSLVFVGDGIDHVRWRALFAECPGTSLFFFPRLGYEEFLRVIWACDVAAFPYPDDPVHRSKCSARIIDYMAMGKAVLTSAVGQNCEYIVNSQNGILVPPNDERQFADHLSLLLRNPALRQRLGRSAEMHLQEKFQWGGTALQQCLAAYEQVLTGRQPRSQSHLRRYASRSLR